MALRAGTAASASDRDTATRARPWHDDATSDRSTLPLALTVEKEALPNGKMRAAQYSRPLAESMVARVPTDGKADQWDGGHAHVLSLAG